VKVLRSWRLWGLALLVGACLLNGLAYRHAYGFTHFARGGTKTPPPRQLSFWSKLEVLLTGPRIPKPQNKRTPADLGLAYETRVLAGYKGVPLEAWWIPCGEPHGLVVVFHGHADSKGGLLRTAAVFRRMGQSTLLVDFYGSGGSGGNETSIGFHESTDVVNAFRYAQGLSRGEPIVLYGESMGAAAILKAIHDEALEPAAIVLASPFDRLLRTVSHRFTDMGAPAFPGAELLVFWGGLEEGFDGFRFNPVDYAADVRCPSLLLSGGRDPFVRPSEAEEIFDRLPPPKRFKIIDGAGHEDLLKARPDEWKEAVSSFLREFHAGAAGG
jgi:alpha-beta hydrolase superfamily lysophospholipase